MYALIVIIILHFPYKRIEAISDENSFKEFDKEMVSSNPLDFPGYQEKVEKIKRKRV